MHVATYHGVLGTVVEIQVASADAQASAAAERRVIDEMMRLERGLSVYDPDSLLVRWRSGLVDDPGGELGPLLPRALDWQARSGGAFNPLTAALTRRWREAETAGMPPTDVEFDGTGGSDARRPLAGRNP